MGKKTSSSGIKGIVLLNVLTTIITFILVRQVYMGNTYDQYLYMYYLLVPLIVNCTAIILRKQNEILQSIQENSKK